MARALRFGVHVAFVSGVQYHLWAGFIAFLIQNFFVIAIYFWLIEGKDDSIFRLNTHTASAKLIKVSWVTKSLTSQKWSIPSCKNHSIYLRSWIVICINCIIGGTTFSSLISVSFDSSKIDAGVTPPNTLTLSFIQSIWSSPKNWYTSLNNQCIGMKLGPVMSVCMLCNLYWRYTKFASSLFKYAKHCSPIISKK